MSEGVWVPGYTRWGVPCYVLVDGDKILAARTFLSTIRIDHVKSYDKKSIKPPHIPEETSQTPDDAPADSAQ